MRPCRDRTDTPLDQAPASQASFSDPLRPIVTKRVGISFYLILGIPLLSSFSWMQAHPKPFRMDHRTSGESCSSSLMKKQLELEVEEALQQSANPGACCDRLQQALSRGRHGDIAWDHFGGPLGRFVWVNSLGELGVSIGDPY